MKRWFGQVDIGFAQNGFTILLDGKPCLSPLKNLLMLGSYPLAEAVAAEWNRQEKKIDFQDMPLTRLAMAQGDIVDADLESAIGEILSYAQNDAICYWASSPEGLMKRQKQNWGESLDVLERRHGLRFNTVIGLNTMPQPDESLQKLEMELRRMPALTLHYTAMLTRLGGSALLAYLWAMRDIQIEQLADQAFLPELYHAGLVGDGASELPHVMGKMQDMLQIDRFYTLSQQKEHVCAIEVKAQIKGRVQGVGYRAWTRKKAQGLGLTGYVRNLDNGMVEALFQGGQGDVHTMLQSCLEGPITAKVEYIKILSFAAAAQICSGFEQLA